MNATSSTNTTAQDMRRTVQRSVLVLGANGRFGLAAAQAFDAAGWHVVAQVRREAAAGMPQRAELLRSSLTGVAQALAARPADRPQPTVVVHGINPVYTRWNEEALPALDTGIALAGQLGARFFLPGNVYNYGDAMPALLNEHTPQRPTTEKGRIRVEMERRLEQHAAAGRLRATVITAGDFFGAGTGSWFDQAIAKPIGRGRIDYPGAPELMHAWAYLPDLARAFVAVAAGPNAAAFERYTYAGHSVTGTAFVAALEEAAGRLGLAPSRGWKHGRMPWPLIRAVGLVLPIWRELARMSYLWRVPHALDGRALGRAAGPLPHTPLVEALMQALQQLDPGAASARTQPA